MIRPSLFKVETRDGLGENVLTATSSLSVVTLIGNSDGSKVNGIIHGYFLNQHGTLTAILPPGLVL